MRQSELRAQLLLLLRHFAVVGFVVVAGKVQQPMQHEHLDFDCESVSLLGSLPLSSVHADGQISGEFFLVLDKSIGGKRQNVCRFIFAAKLPVESSDCLVAGKQDGNLAAQANGGLRPAEKGRQRARRGQSVGAGSGDGRSLYGGRSRRRGRIRIWPECWVEKDHRARSPCAESND